MRSFVSSLLLVAALTSMVTAAPARPVHRHRHHVAAHHLSRREVELEPPFRFAPRLADATNAPHQAAASPKLSLAVNDPHLAAPSPKLSFAVSDPHPAAVSPKLSLAVNDPHPAAASPRLSFAVNDPHRAAASPRLSLSMNDPHQAAASLAPSLRLTAGHAATVESDVAPGPTQLAPVPAVVVVPAVAAPAVVAPAVVAPSLVLTALAKAPSREHRWDLLGGGIALFLGGYALDVGLSYGLGHDTSTSLIPLAGPLLQLRDRWGTIGPTQSGNAIIDQAGNAGISVVNQVIQDAAYVMLSVDFVLQLAGAAMTVVGAVGHPPRRYAMPRDVAWSVSPGGVRVRF
jgi:hypothetical protein